MAARLRRVRRCAAQGTVRQHGRARTRCVLRGQHHTPAIKTLMEFNDDFAKGVKRSQIEDLAGLGFSERNENVVLVGPSGVGKTHLR